MKGRRGRWRGLRLLLMMVMMAFAVPARGSAQKAEHPGAPALRDGQHDFDFEFGSWDVRLRRLVEPLTGSDEWVECTGLSTVRQVWNGRANLGELEVDCPGRHIQGLSFRLYQPASRQWYIRWTTSADGELGPPMIGGFDAAGRGEFYNQEMFRGQAIYVRFIFSDITRDAFRIEQAFSADGGTRWETNWITTFSRRAE